MPGVTIDLPDEHSDQEELMSDLDRDTILEADQFSSIISVLDLNPTGSLFVDQVDHDLFVKNTCCSITACASAKSPGSWCPILT